MPLAKARGARRRKSDSPPPPPLSAATDRQLRDVLAVLAGADAPRVSQLSGVFAPPTEGPLCVSLAGVVRGLLDASAAYSTAGKMGLPVFMSGEQYGSREAKDFFDARVLVFDLDNPVNPVTHDALRALGLLAFAYDTASSITKRPRQRLVVVLDRDASAAEYRRLGALVASRLAALGIFVSPESFEHARVFFLPARSEFMDGGEPHRWRPCAFAGEPLPVDRWLAALDAFEQEQGMALVAVLGPLNVLIEAGKAVTLDLGLTTPYYDESDRRVTSATVLLRATFAHGESSVLRTTVAMPSPMFSGTRCDR